MNTLPEPTAHKIAFIMRMAWPKQKFAVRRTSDHLECPKFNVYMEHDEKQKFTNVSIEQFVVPHFQGQFYLQFIPYSRYAQ